MTSFNEKGERFIGCGELLLQKDYRSIEKGLLLFWELLEFLCIGHHLQGIVSSGPFVLFEGEGKVLEVVVVGRGEIIQLGTFFEMFRMTKSSSTISAAQ